MAIQPRHAEEHFRQTGKFKPISDHQLSPERSLSKFTIQSFQRLPPTTFIPLTQAARLWRVYLDETAAGSSEENLKQVIMGAFEYLDCSESLSDGSELFVNVGGMLIQKLREKEEKFCLSQLDYNCAIVKFEQASSDSLLDVYVCEGRPPADRDFTEEISIKLRQEPDAFYLVQRSKMLYIVKNLLKNYPILELTDQNLDETSADVGQQKLVIKNLSSRIVAVKFQQENISKSLQPLMITIGNKDIYNLILFKINRIKYQRYRIEDSDAKEWHSFDNICQQPQKKQTKTTPDKTKTRPNKISILSTNAVEDSKQSQNKKKIPVISQPRHLKISQRVATNPKESNLVPSEVDYAVSVKDEKEKDNPYFDEFQNLLYEQEGGEEKQLTLNDSFQEFQKKEHSEKNLEIIKELNKRKEKETQEKRILDSLKQKLKEVMAEEKEWINKNLKLKSDIKKLKNPQIPQQNKEIDEIKMKIGELKLQERILLEELSQIKKNNSIETLVACQGGAQDSSQSQRGKQKIFLSINNLPLQPNSFNPLTNSVRSNVAASKFPQPSIIPQISTPEGSSSIPSPAYKQSFRTNFPMMHSPPTNPISLYSSIPSQSIIQQNYFPTNQPRTPQNLLGSVDHGGFPRPVIHNTQNSMAFTSAIFPSGRVGMGSPLGAKKNSFQVFPTANNNKN